MMQTFVVKGLPWLQTECVLNMP